MIRVGDEVGEDISGSLGPILVDSAGNILIATARILLLEGGIVRSDSHAVGVRPHAYFPRPQTPRSSAEFIGWFIPDPGERIDPRGVTAGLAPSRGLLNSDVLVVGHPRIRGAYVAGLRIRTDFEPMVGAPEAADDLIALVIPEAAIAELGGSLGGTGLAGALVTTLSGQAVGIVVGFCEDELLLAPMEKVINAESLILATAEHVKSHNDRAVDIRSSNWSGMVPTVIEELRQRLGLPASMAPAEILSIWVLHKSADGPTSELTDYVVPEEEAVIGETLSLIVGLYPTEVDVNWSVMDDAMAVFSELQRTRPPRRERLFHAYSAHSVVIGDNS